MAKATILIIEDDRDILEMVEYNLLEDGYEVISALDGRQGFDTAVKKVPDLIILDIMLPVRDGFEVCRMLKADSRTAGIPIIILSAKSQEIDKVTGLELGADDYVTKPFSPRELIARIRAILRRGHSNGTSDKLKVGDIVIDRARHLVLVAEEEISLTRTEFDVLEAMARRAGSVMSRNRILDMVAGDDTVVCDRTVDAHIKSLRRKLGAARDCIETVRGVGYRFREA